MRAAPGPRPRCRRRRVARAPVDAGQRAVAAALLPLAGVERLLVDTGYRADELHPGREPRPARRRRGASRSCGSSRSRSGWRRAAWTQPGTRGRSATPSRQRCRVRSRGSRSSRTAAGSPSDLGRDARRSSGRRVAGSNGSTAGEPVRLTDPVLLAFGLWAAVDTGLPLQVHTGYRRRGPGPAPLLTRSCSPTSSARPKARARCCCCTPTRSSAHAGYLAQMFAHVYVDVGLAVNHTGVQSEQLIAESLELAPFTQGPLLVGRMGSSRAPPAGQLAVPARAGTRARALGRGRRLEPRRRGAGHRAHRPSERPTESTVPDFRARLRVRYVLRRADGRSVRTDAGAKWRIGMNRTVTAKALTAGVAAALALAALTPIASARGPHQDRWRLRADRRRVVP